MYNFKFYFETGHLTGSDTVNVKKNDLEKNFF